MRKIKNNGIDYYAEDIPIGRYANGRIKYKQILGKTQKECISNIEAYKKNGSLDIGVDRTMFGELFKEWLDTVRKPSTKLSSYNRYFGLYRNYIEPATINNMRLTEIKILHMQKFYNCIDSAHTAKLVKNLINSFFTYCIDTDMIVKNPQNTVRLKEPKPTRHSRALNEDERRIIANNPSFIYTFALYTGLRLGEALALTHNDINFKDNEINVNKTLRYMNTGEGCEFVITDTKTVSSTRKVPISKTMFPLLLEHMKAEKEKHLLLGMTFKTTNPLFTSINGNYCNPDNVLVKLKRLKLNCTFHDLRHTFCTMLAENGVDLKTASVLMGHSDIKMTAEIYTHVNEKVKQNAIDKIIII